MAQAIKSVPGRECAQSIEVSRTLIGYRVLRKVLQALFRVVFRVKVEGVENVPDAPVIVCANHLGWADTLIVLLFVPSKPRIYVVGDKDVKTLSRFRRLLVERSGVIQLDKAKPVEALRTMKSVVGQGGSLLVFPEGKLGSEEGSLSPLQKGSAHISIQSGVPLLPVGLTGTSKLWVRRHLTLRIGHPVRPDGLEIGSLHSKLDELTGRLGTEMQRLLPGDTDMPKVRLLERWLTRLL